MEARFLPYSPHQGQYCRNAMSDEKRMFELLDRSIEDTDPRDPGGDLPSRSEISGSASPRSPQTIITDPTSTIDDQLSCYRQFTQAASARSASSSTISTRRSGFTCQSDRPPSNLEEVLRSSSISGRGDQSLRQIGDTLSVTSTVGTRPVPTGCPTKAHIIEVLWPWVKSIEPGTEQTHFVCKALLESYAERVQAFETGAG
jgi:hypothetical protein